MFTSNTLNNKLTAINHNILIGSLSGQQGHKIPTGRQDLTSWVWAGTAWARRSWIPTHTKEQGPAQADRAKLALADLRSLTVKVTQEGQEQPTGMERGCLNYSKVVPSQLLEVPLSSHGLLRGMRVLIQVPSAWSQRQLKAGTTFSLSASKMFKTVPFLISFVCTWWPSDLSKYPAFSPFMFYHHHNSSK